MPVTVWEKFGFCLGRVSRLNSEKRKPDGCEVAAEPLGDPSHYSRRANIFRFLSLVCTPYKRQLDLRNSAITAGLTSPT